MSGHCKTLRQGRPVDIPRAKIHQLHYRANLGSGGRQRRDGGAVEHFVAAVNLADGSDLWYRRCLLPWSRRHGDRSCGRVFVTLDTGQVLCLRAAAD